MLVYVYNLFEINTLTEKRLLPWDNYNYSELPLIQPRLDQKKVAGIKRWLDLRDTLLIQQHSKEIKLAGIGRKIAWSLTHYACVCQVLLTCMCMHILFNYNTNVYNKEMFRRLSIEFSQS